MSWRIRIPIRESLDRRAVDRLVLKAEVDTEVDGERVKGEVKDISVRGLRLHLPQYVEPGKELYIRLKVPFEANEEGEIRIHSEVKWCKPVNDKEFVAGLSYLHVEAQEQEKLFLLVSELMLNWIMAAQEGLIDNETE